MVATFPERGTRQAGPNEFPSYATLVNIESPACVTRIICSGTLITAAFVLTTANCISKNKISTTRIMLGKVKVYGLLDSNIHSIAWWKDYSNWALENTRLVEPHPQLNIAIIRLSKPVHINEYVRPALVPFEMTFPKCQKISVSLIGWAPTRGCEKILKTVPSKIQTLSSIKENCVPNYPNAWVAEGKVLLVENAVRLGVPDEGGPLLHNGNILMAINYGGASPCNRRNRQFHINSTYYEDFLRYYMFGYE
ncbi:hypothetical protein QAD02_001072 [Eretmocerus hayati]|uniref:Uncharacterized protein n=1 Tax=Eretmocerus hayati TaxID=131215 RepID=A0ACC2NGB0_9HYME|nr:hypothetical protein QAD02_001072 [Eretmocerus hayati]